MLMSFPLRGRDDLWNVRITCDLCGRSFESVDDPDYLDYDFACLESVGWTFRGCRYLCPSCSCLC